jgi:hypothetical protein
VLVQHLEIDEAGGATRRLETRVLVRELAAWRPYPYRWDASGLDAVLDLDGHDIPVTVEESGAPLAFDWHVPAETECTACHSAAAGVVLGVRTDQMNRDFAYPAMVDNQLRSFAHIGLFTTALAAPSAYPALADPYAAGADPAVAARTLLDGNCSHCHRPGGTAPGSMDLRDETPLAAMGVVGAPPLSGDLGIPGAEIVAPGERARSVLYERMRRLDGTHMPPPSRRIDQAGSEIIGVWIDSLPP